MNILALDLSLRATGYAHSDGRAGVIKMPGDGMPRIRAILDTIWPIAEGVEVIVAEGYSFGSNMAYAREGAELGGVVRFTFFEQGRPIVDVPPSCLKMFATANGNASKPDMLMAAVKKLAWDGSTDDNVIDARWLLEMASAHYDGRTCTAKQQQALSKIQWPAVPTPRTAP